MEFILDQIVNGIITGSMYALIAAGMTMIFGVLRAINFAHGEYYMVGTFAAWYVISKFGADYTGDNPRVLAFVREQNWFNAEDFAKGLAIARARHPKPPGKPTTPPPLPVEALLRASATMAPPVEALPSPEPAAPELIQPAKPTPYSTIQNQEDAPPCSTCGSIMIRSGACYKCSNCGNTSGCA